MSAYDVFLSFRGVDTRNNFTGHLYMALNRAGVRTFRDDEELRIGENISESLMAAIRDSRIYVVVISEKFADSSWCLDELVQIMECNRTLGRKVCPIFYHVAPSDVRRQKAIVGEAFERHEARNRRTQSEISSWRSALTHIADLAGWVLSDFGSEAEFVTKIVDTISRELNNTYLHVAVYPVGVESRIKDICNSLCDGKEDDVRMVGIVGMGGSGKSSLAKAVYNKVYHTFENKSFLGNVRETVKESNGKITLQERLLSDILKPTKIEVGDADRGIVVITERLGSKKVLVIVDNVDDMDQLTALALGHGSIGWRKSFGPGSRIVITTRDRRLLEQLEVDKIHDTQEMKEEALELFSWHAFHNPCPDSEFLELTGRVVTYCGGLPLALEVLGSFLFKGNRRHWETTLKKLERFPHDKIYEILKISYDALDENQREIFLHISCFFVGMDRKYVTHILHGCGDDPEGEISVLLQRCLVTVSERNKLMIHDLLRDMGREVVRAESPKRPEKRSRLWRQQDVIAVLTEESGTKKIEGLALNLQRYDKKRFRTLAFLKMNRLKLLQLNYVQLDGDYDHLSKQLRWLCWRGFPLSTIGNKFPNEQNLVSIDMRYSKLEQVWEQSRALKKLKILNLSHSHYLTHTPDFSYLPKLKYLILKDCKILSEIDESIGNLGKLVLVNLKDCIMLKDLPKRFYNLKSVETLVLTGCSRFQNLSDDIGNMASLITLLVSGTAISRVPSCLKRLQLNYSSRQDLTLVKLRFPDVPRDHLPDLPHGFTSTDMGNSSVHSLPECPGKNVSPSGDLPTGSRDLESHHCTAHAVIPYSSKASRQSILQGWTGNGEGGGFFIDCISLSDILSKLLNRDLATIWTKLETDHYSNALELVAKFSKALRPSILQGLTAKEDDGICLVGNDFLKRFTCITESDLVFFQVPQSNLLALTVCAVCSCFNRDMSASRISILVTNLTKLLSCSVQPTHLTELTSHEVICQGQIPINQLNLEGEDFVVVEVSGSGLRVKKTGVCLVWGPDLIIEKMECEPNPYGDFRKTSSSTACRNKSGNFTFSSEVCFNCGDPKHVISECPHKKEKHFLLVDKLDGDKEVELEGIEVDPEVRRLALDNVMIYVPTPASYPVDGVEAVNVDANPPSPGWTYVNRRNMTTPSRDEGNQPQDEEVNQRDKGKMKMNVCSRRKPALVKTGFFFKDVAKGQGVIMISDEEVKKNFDEGSQKNSSNEEEVGGNFGAENFAASLEKENEENEDLNEYDVRTINGKTVLVFRANNSDMDASTGTVSKKRNRDMTEDNSMAEATADGASSVKLSKK